MVRTLFVTGLFFLSAMTTVAAEPNDLAYLDECNPWYPHKDFPKLTTPQWVGEDGVDCVVVLAIDDMRDTAKYEQYLRPILNRLKQIDGRAPVSIMTCEVKPDDPQLQSWLDEGLSIEVHTIDHPCPILQGGDFDKAKSTYDRCVDLLAKIPNNKPVAFRTPCCDSLNTVSPRFYAEIFNKTTADGNHLQIDSSVFNFFTSDDETIPRDLVLDANGEERFWKYLPRENKYKNLTHDKFVNYIKNYPYPYVINNSCWQFPCVAPSDWSAQHLHGVDNPITVADWKAALDITVHKKGVFNLVFHPHGWISAENVVELIDHAVENHGSKVKFLTFREAAQRLKKSLTPDAVLLNETRLVDIDDNGFLDVIDGGLGVADFNHASKDQLRDASMKLWHDGQWKRSPFPVHFVDLFNHFPGRISRPVSLFRQRDKTHLTVFDPDSALQEDEFTTVRQPRLWTHENASWKSQPIGPPGELDELKISWRPNCCLWRDFDGDGVVDVLLHHNLFNARWDEALGDDIGQNVSEIWGYDHEAATWKPRDWSVPVLPSVCDLRSLRFVDLNDDKRLDLIASNENVKAVWLQAKDDTGWTRKTSIMGKISLLPLTRPMQLDHPLGKVASLSDNGFFVEDRHLCWMNEDTAHLPNFIHRVAFDDLLTEVTQKNAARELPPVPIGAAVVDITPDFPIRLSGYGNRKLEATEVAAKIHARALAIGGPGVSAQRSVLITVDNCGVPMNVTEAVFDVVTKKHGVPRERFAISSTHTHSAPWLRGFAPNILMDVPDNHVAHLQEYESQLIDKLVAVVDDAIAKQRPGHLSVGRGKVNFAINRRVMKAGQWSGFGDVPQGPVDHQLPVLAAHDTDGKLIAVLASYACHATTETGQLNKISSDWPGLAADMIEADHPGAVALVAIGCGADANPSPRGTHELAVQHGRSLADEVKRLVRKNNQQEWANLKRISPHLDCELARIDLPLGPLPTREQWEQRAKRSGHAGVHGKKYLQMLNDGQPIPTTVPDYPVQTWCFGDDLAMVFLGGEVVVDYSLRLNSMFDSERLWINAYSNDVPCYIASKRILREGGYEADSSMVYYDRPTRLAPEAEDLICDTVQKLLPHEFYAEELQAEFPGPKSPEESLACVTTHERLQVELVAAEPLITDPVAFDWDVQGRMWVVEMGDYPGTENNAKRAETEGGRVRVLEDVDQDRIYDKATTFLKDLPFPTGIHRWRNGVIITAAPDIIYAEDTDGDFVADVRKVLYTGFTEGNQQHRINGLRWGLDGWLYLANGDSGGKIKAVGGVLKAPSPATTSPVDIGGRDVRIQPDYGRIETLSGRSQFGRERDDFGNWFGNNNSNPIWHYVLEDRYLRRNPHVTDAATKHEVSTTPGAAPVFPTSRTLSRFNDFDKANRFTSACSTSIFRSEVLGDEFNGNALVCEPVHNLVSRLVLERDGISFVGHRAEGEKEWEFFASSDNWTRPVMVRTGPDGALYIADMYRQVIEHPEWIPAEYQRKMNLSAGSDRGRIYRIVPAGNVTFHSTFLEQPWDEAPMHEFLDGLSSNGWWRDTTQRILMHRKYDADISTFAGRMVFDSSPIVRFQALWTICNLRKESEYREAYVVKSLSDPHFEVRRTAVRILEGSMPQHDGDVLPRLVPLVDDPSLVVRHQLALSLGYSKDSRAAKALAQLWIDNADTPEIVTAVKTSLTPNNIAAVLKAAAANPQIEVPGTLPAGLIEQAAAMKQWDAIREPLTAMLASLPEEGTSTNPSRWLEAGRSMEAVLRSKDQQATLLKTSDFAAALNSATQQALVDSVNETRPTELRVAMLTFLSVVSVSNTQANEHILPLFSATTPVEVQQAAVDVMGRHSRSALASLFGRWREITPSIRSRVLQQFLLSSSRSQELLKAVADKTLTPRDLDAATRARLLHHRDSDIQAQARELFGTAQSTARGEIVSQWRTKLEGLSGDAAAGRGVFEKQCSVCHRLQNIGKSIGADLATLKNRSTEALLTAILDPNRAVEAKFLSYTAVTSNGLTHQGMLLRETGNSITLIGTDGKELSLSRADLEELQCANRSLMPEGLEKDLAPQELSDVIAFVQSSGGQSKRFDGNNPQLVTPNADGTLTLSAATAEIHGPNLVYESKHRNLGWWSSVDDYAVWTIDVPRGGLWTVQMEYACENSTAGNLLKLSTGSRLLSARVPGSGTWDDYKTWTAGQIDLGKGRRQLTMTAVEKPTSALIDLKSIRLIPPAAAK